MGGGVMELEPLRVLTVSATVAAAPESEPSIVG